MCVLELTFSPSLNKTQGDTAVKIARFSLRRAIQAAPGILGAATFSPNLHTLSHHKFHNPLKMAWSCSGSTNKALVENLWACGLIEDQRVKDAFLQVRGVASLSVRVGFQLVLIV